MKQVKGFSTLFANRIENYQKINVFSKFSRLAMQTQSVNLGQGFPDYKVVDFIRSELLNSIQNEPLTYQSSEGAIELRKSISQFFSPYFKQNIQWDKEIVVSHGATTTLHSVIQAFINPGDEVVIIDPSFDIYRPLVEFAGGVCRSIQITPKKQISCQKLQTRNNLEFQMKDDVWQIDWKQVYDIINPKTKAIILNLPQNPTGKIFTQEELNEFAKILKQHPKVLVISDEAYSHIVFKPYQPFQHPRPAQHPDLKDQTITIFSIGKIFSCAGLRLGFAVANERLTKAINLANKVSVKQLNRPFQLAAAKFFEICSKNTYFQDKANVYQQNVKHLTQSLIDSEYDFDLWMPEGGYFIVTDISRVYIEQKYMVDQETGQQLDRDAAFIYKLVEKNKVVGIPLQTFYSPEIRSTHNNYIRFAYCKDQVTLNKARANLSKHDYL